MSSNTDEICRNRITSRYPGDTGLSSKEVGVNMVILAETCPEFFIINTITQTASLCRLLPPRYNLVNSDLSDTALLLY